jgi:outer membrane protein OmpA-like peptidoglycan-associated protein
MVGMLARIVAALVVAFLVSGLTGEWLAASGVSILEADSLRRAVERGWTQAQMAWPFALLAVMIAETVGVRSLIYYLAAGALVAVGAASFDWVSWNFDLGSSWLPRWRDGILLMGGLGGLAYWVVHGHKSGLAGAAAKGSLKKEPMAALLGSMSSSRGVMASLVALAAAAGIGWWALDDTRFNDTPLRDAERSVGAALTTGGYPWAKLTIAGDVGQIVGLAPDAKSRDAAFTAAKQVAQPLIGPAGVMASLENKLTIPEPTVVAAAAAAARKAAEDAARAAAESEAKRKSEENARRTAAVEAENKRRAEEQAKRVAAEADVKRKSDEESKRVAAEMEAKRVAAEAEAKRKADEETKRVAIETEARRRADADAKRFAAEAEAAKQKADAEVKRIAAEADAAKQKADAEAKRIAADNEAKRRADEEGKRAAAEAEAAKRKAEQEAKRIAAEAEAAKRKADLEAKLAEARAKRATDEAAKKLAAAMADKKADIPAKIAAVPVGPAPAKAAVPAPSVQPVPASGSTSAPCTAQTTAVITTTRIALRRSDAELTADTQRQLDRLAEALRSCGDVAVRVAGFSTRGFDKRAKAHHSRLLALRVATELTTRGVNASRLQTAGLGSSMRTLTGETGITGLPTRRVELAVLAPSTKPAPPGPAATTQSCKAEPEALRLRFGSSQAQPSGSYRAELDRIAAILLSCGGGRFVIEGHTDATGRDDLNKRLSERRANLVLRALVRRGVPEATLTATGFGSAKPLDSSGTPAAKAANRRVDIVIVAPSSPSAPTAVKK